LLGKSNTLRRQAMAVKTLNIHETDAHPPRKVLVIDIGGTSVKLLVSGQHERRMFPSGPKMMPDKMVRKTLEMVRTAAPPSSS
jgi:hexokinase